MCKRIFVWHNTSMSNAVPILSLMTLIAGAFYILVGVVLAYHWIRFSASHSITILSLTAYIVAGTYLLGLMAGAIMTV